MYLQLPHAQNSENKTQINKTQDPASTRQLNFQVRTSVHSFVCKRNIDSITYKRTSLIVPYPVCSGYLGRNCVQLEV